jgi:hypothetical protein
VVGGTGRCELTSRDLKLLLADLAAPVDAMEEVVVVTLFARRSLQVKPASVHDMLGKCKSAKLIPVANPIPGEQAIRYRVLRSFHLMEGGHLRVLDLVARDLGGVGGAAHGLLLLQVEAAPVSHRHRFLHC